MKTKKLCVVGSGYWGQNHIKTLSNLNLLGGVVDTNSASLRKIQKEYNVPVFQSVEESLELGNFIGYVVSTPAETHYEIAKKIILSNKHVLVEKPLTLSIKDSLSLVSLSKEHNVNLMVGHVLLFHNAIKKIKYFIDSGKIGKLQYIYSNRLNLGKVRSNENVFWSLAPHDISIFQYFTNSYPTKIQASGSAFLQKGIHDSTITQLTYPNDVNGHIFVSWLHPFKEHRLVVIGSEAMMSFEDSIDDKPLKLHSKKFDTSKGIPEKIDGPVEVIKYEKMMPLTEELKYFYKHCISGKPEIAGADHALQVTKILVEASDRILNNTP